MFSSFFSSDGRSWAASRASVGGPGPLSVPLWVAPSRSQGLCGRCWPVLKLLWAVLGSLRSALRCYVGGLGPLLGPMFAVVGRLGVLVGGPGPSWSHSLVLCWRSWVALGTYVGGLGRSWGLCWRSWAVLGRKMSKNMTTLKMCLFLERERDLPPRGAVLGLPWTLCWRS